MERWGDAEPRPVMLNVASLQRIHGARINQRDRVASVHYPICVAVVVVLALSPLLDAQPATGLFRTVKQTLVIVEDIPDLAAPLGLSKAELQGVIVKQLRNAGISSPIEESSRS